MRFNTGDKVSIRYGDGWLSGYVVLGYVNVFVLVGSIGFTRYVFWFNEEDLKLTSEVEKEKGG